MYEQLSFGLSDLEDEKYKSYESIAEAEKVAIERIKVASEMSDYYYHEKLIITYSGGKDSDVILHLAEKSGVPFICQYSVTTVDAPQTTRHDEYETYLYINLIKWSIAIGILDL